MARHVSLAVQRLYATVNSNLATELAAVETEESLVAGSLTVPADILRYRAPMHHTSPMIEVFDEGFTYDSQRQRLMDIECIIRISYQGGEDLDATELFMRRYVTAVIQVIETTPGLGDVESYQAVVVAGEADVQPGSDSASWYRYSINVTVSTCSP